jgi:hypothetical protein
MAANEDHQKVEATNTLPKISLDTWAVIFALVAATLIRLGVLKHIPW